jgi:opacity protein-like surface antigen
MSNNLPYQVTTDGFYFNLDRSLGQMNYQFAWAVMAGVAIAMTEQAQLDVGYRFLDLGNVSGISSVTGASVTQRVFVNELRAGVRYMLD